MSFRAAIFFVAISAKWRNGEMAKWLSGNYHIEHMIIFIFTAKNIQFYNLYVRNIFIASEVIAFTVVPSWRQFLPMALSFSCLGV